MKKNTIKKIVIGVVSSVLAMCVFGALTALFAKEPCETHEWDEGVVAKEANCKEMGEIIYTCTVCGEKKEETFDIAPEAHIWDEGTVTVAATCTTNGETTYVCTLCGIQKVLPIAMFGGEHEDVNLDCKCDKCDTDMSLAEGTYTEVAATVGETVAGNWYRFYYDENARLDLRFVNGFEQPDISLNVGFMLYVDNSQLNFMALDGSVTVSSDSSLEFVLNEDGQYVDFFIPQGFILNAYNTIGTEEVYSVQFTDETLLSSVSQLDKLFVLEVK